MGRIPCLCPRKTRTHAPVSKSQHRAVRSYDVEKRKSPKEKKKFAHWSSGNVMMRNVFHLLNTL